MVAVLLSASTCAQAEDVDLGAGETATSRSEIRKIIEREAARTNLPADIVEAVVFVESGYNSAVVGNAGEVGLMQVRLDTAAALGFKGNATELAEPDLNIHYGVLSLSHAWRLTGGDLCRTLMKYWASSDNDEMTLCSRVYCNRARNRLLALNSAAAVTQSAAVSPSVPTPELAAAPAPATKSARTEKPQTQPGVAPPKGVYASYRPGTAAASRAFWAAHEARGSRIKARIEARGETGGLALIAVGDEADVALDEPAIVDRKTADAPLFGAAGSIAPTVFLRNPNKDHAQQFESFVRDLRNGSRGHLNLHRHPVHRRLQRLNQTVPASNTDRRTSVQASAPRTVR
ncbi:transglycosylase SLT domain-containing protein [Bradyrhizobium sp. SSUT112]|uniref:transglycosylase SLT domain-containing protein n=1 Tax=Bradyrhizobium sp. SSUT112 TaxID=3040604 RepID=UPI002446ADD6|nr:transglycosylase SLT domain-containing protein [Bradyrhizobium sp. SSUT112]MDH2354991.1 transglycosylase SLT domain-containing protein [Bradyrhizobium sp. SSUT112]